MFKRKKIDETVCVTEDILQRYENDIKEYVSNLGFPYCEVAFPNGSVHVSFYYKNDLGSEPASYLTIYYPERFQEILCDPHQHSGYSIAIHVCKQLAGWMVESGRLWTIKSDDFIRKMEHDVLNANYQIAREIAWLKKEEAKEAKVGDAV